MSAADSSAPREAVPVRDQDELERVVQAPLAVLYKHSPLCGLSAIIAREVRAFMAARPRVPVYILDVIRARPLSREVERRLSIRHESPQAFVLRQGAVSWHGSHRAITEEVLARETEAEPSGPAAAQ